MPNELFQQFGGGSAPSAPAAQAAPAQGQPDFQAMLNSLQANPAAMLQQAGLNVPQNILGSPRQMVEHLMRTGQVHNPGAVQSFMSQMMGRR